MFRGSMNIIAITEKSKDSILALVLTNNGV